MVAVEVALAAGAFATLSGGGVVASYHPSVLDGRSPADHFAQESQKRRCKWLARNRPFDHCLQGDFREGMGLDTDLSHFLDSTIRKHARLATKWYHSDKAAGIDHGFAEFQEITKVMLDPKTRDEYITAADARRAEALETGVAMSHAMWKAFNSSFLKRVTPSKPPQVQEFANEKLLIFIDCSGSMAGPSRMPRDLPRRDGVREVTPATSLPSSSQEVTPATSPPPSSREGSFPDGGTTLPQQDSTPPEGGSTQLQDNTPPEGGSTLPQLQDSTPPEGGSTQLQAGTPPEGGSTLPQLQDSTPPEGGSSLPQHSLPPEDGMPQAEPVAEVGRTPLTNGIHPLGAAGTLPEGASETQASSPPSFATKIWNVVSGKCKWDDGTMKSRTEVAKEMLIQLYPRIRDESNVSLHIIGSRGFSQCILNEDEDPATEEEYTSRITNDGGQTYLWEYVYDNVRELKHYPHRVDIYIISDGWDNQSSAPFHGCDGFNALMERVGNLRINLWGIGDEICTETARTYESLCLATGGVFGTDRQATEVGALNGLQTFALLALMPQETRDLLAIENCRQYHARLAINDVKPFSWALVPLTPPMETTTPGTTTPQTTTLRFAVEDKVRIHGLKTNQHLEGTLATCKEWLADRDRWMVQLANGEMKAFKQSNLRPEPTRRVC